MSITNILLIKRLPRHPRRRSHHNDIRKFLMLGYIYPVYLDAQHPCIDVIATDYR